MSLASVDLDWLFFHVVDLCGGDEETLKPPRHEEESSLPHLGNLEWA